MPSYRRYHIGVQTCKLAQLNIGRLIAPLDDRRIAGFVAQLDTINRLAEASPGFVWRLKSEDGNATDFRWNDDPQVIVNLSVWEAVEALHRFVYQTQHLQVLRDRALWFEKPSLPQACLWWVPSEHKPGLVEARAKLEHFQMHGSAPEVFWFSKPYPTPN